MGTQTLLMIGTVILVVIAVLLWRLLTRKEEKPDDSSLLLNQRLDAMQTSMNTALRDTMKMVSAELKDSRTSTERATLNVHKQVEGFTVGLTKLTENLQAVHETVKDVSSFQDIFRSPKLRGIWGEASLEASLEQYFPPESYSLQHYFKSGVAVDAILKLPNELILPVDSKFNWDNFQKMVNAESDIERGQHQKVFFSDVKKKIDEIASKYILPSEGTTDLALMFVPAETVYYEIISSIKDMDIPAYAEKRKVWLVSPNTFGLSVSAIRHWLKDVQVSRETKKIMKKLDRITTDGGKLSDSFRKLGKHISDTRSAYDDSEKRLELMTDRVQRIIEFEGPDGDLEKKELI